jgi:hypothetical protein
MPRLFDSWVTRDDFIRAGACQDGVEMFCDEHSLGDLSAINPALLLQIASISDGDAKRWIFRVLELYGLGYGKAYGYGSSSGNGFSYCHDLDFGNGDGIGDGWCKGFNGYGLEIMFGDGSGIGDCYGFGDFNGSGLSVSI